MTSTDQLLSEFIDAWNAGRRPRIPDVLRRVPAGPQREDLAAQLRTWLETAPTPAYDEAARAGIRATPAVRRALATAGLPVARERAGLSLADLATRLVRVLGLPARAAPAAERHLAQLEAGRPEGRGPTRRLLGALAEALEGAGPAPAPAAVAFRGPPGASAGGVSEELHRLTSLAFEPEDPDAELERLFSAGPEG